jgi:hypothetical protein
MKKENAFIPMKVFVRGGSRAAEYNLSSAGYQDQEVERLAPSPDALAKGFRPTPKENLVFQGGKTIVDLTFTNFYIGGKDAWDPADIKNIDWSLDQAMSDEWLNNVMRQYFDNKPITAKFHPSTVLDGAPPNAFSQGDAKALVASLFTNDVLKGYDLPNTVICFMLPKGTILTDDVAPHKGAARRGAKAKSRPFIPAEDEDSSLEGLGGYHGSVHIDTKTTVYYAVGVYSFRQDNGKDNGIVAFDAPWKNVVATFYHELCEARTDADVDDAIRTNNDKYCGWVSKSGSECGDYPMTEAGDHLGLVMKEVALANGKGKVPIQYQYSNAVNGPEGPIKSLH